MKLLKLLPITTLTAVAAITPQITSCAGWKKFNAMQFDESAHEQLPLTDPKTKMSPDQVWDAYMKKPSIFKTDIQYHSNLEYKLATEDETKNYSKFDVSCKGFKPTITNNTKFISYDIKVSTEKTVTGDTNPGKYCVDMNISFKHVPIQIDQRLLYSLNLWSTSVKYLDAWDNSSSVEFDFYQKYYKIIDNKEKLFAETQIKTTYDQSTGHKWDSEIEDLYLKPFSIICSWYFKNIEQGS